MKNSQDVLSSILKTTQMGQLGIRSILNMSMAQDLKCALHAQLAEYDAIETEAHTLATQRGWELPEIDPAVKIMLSAMNSVQLRGKNRSSKIAKSMVMGNTRGLVKGYQNLHAYQKPDAAIYALGQKLLDTESANVRQMEDFL